MPPPAKGRSVVKEPPKAFPIREWSAREFCIQKKEDGGVWGKTLPSILVLGKRYSGKTCAGIDLCFELQDQFDCAVVFSGSDDVSPTFSKIIPDIFVYREITAERIDRILKRQTELSDKYENDPNVNPQLLVIFDDIMNDRNSATEEFLDLFKKGRHYRILVLVLAQYFNDMSPIARQNSDYILTAAELAKPTRKKMYLEWFSAIKDEVQYNTLFDHYTEDYRMFVACQRTKSNKPEDRVFWFKAQHIEPDFKFGSPEFWFMGEMYQKPRRNKYDPKAPAAEADVNNNNNNAVPAEQEDDRRGDNHQHDPDVEGNGAEGQQQNARPQAARRQNNNNSNNSVSSRQPVAAHKDSWKAPPDALPHSIKRTAPMSQHPSSKKSTGGAQPTWDISKFLPENAENARQFLSVDRYGRIMTDF